MTITPPPSAAEPAPSVRAETLRTRAKALRLLYPWATMLDQTADMLDAAAADIERLEQEQARRRAMFVQALAMVEDLCEEWSPSLKVTEAIDRWRRHGLTLYDGPSAGE